MDPAAGGAPLFSCVATARTRHKARRGARGASGIFEFQIVAATSLQMSRSQLGRVTAFCCPLIRASECPSPRLCAARGSSGIVVASAPFFAAQCDRKLHGERCHALEEIADIV